MTDTTDAELGGAAERRIEYLPLAELLHHRHPRNPKDHDLDDIERSFRRFGFTAPILICERTGLIAAGHGRLAALERRAGRHPEPPRGIRVNEDVSDWLVPVVRGWASVDDDELIAYVVADNNLVQKGGWQLDPLATILTELADLPDGLDGLGWDAADVDRIVAEAALVGGRVSLDDGSQWDRMPAFANEDRQSQYRVMVHFPTPEHRDEFFRLIERPVQSSFWWPHDDGLVGADWSQKWTATDTTDTTAS